MVGKINKFLQNENGQGMVEYALILALIALVVVGALGTLGQSVKKVYQNEELLDALQDDGE